MTMLTESRALSVARRNLLANGLANGLDDAAIDREFVFARDGALTALDSDGKWITGCSIPRRAAQDQLRKMEVVGSLACFLDPPHASAVREALVKLRPEQGCIAIVPDPRVMRMMLACEDFSRDADRVFFVSGEDWPDELRKLLEREPGLAIPTQFVRLPTSAPELINAMIAAAQKIFSEITTSRSERQQQLRESWIKRDRAAKFCLVAPTQRRLWNNWGNILLKSLDDKSPGELGDFVHVDPDQPRQSSPLAVSQAASDCDAIVTIDLSRADVANVVPDDMPWITWCVSGRIPQRAECGARDRLLLLDPQDADVARANGWEKFVVAQPARELRSACEAASGLVALVTETSSLDPPANIDDFSSHRLLWESIAGELTRDPFALRGDAHAYLDARMKTFGIDDSTLHRARFVSMLIVPAYQEGLHRALLDAKIPVTRSHDDRDLDAGAVVLHCWPDQSRLHAIDFAAARVIRPGRSREEFLKRAKDALAGRAPLATHAGSTLCGNLLIEFLAED